MPVSRSLSKVNPGRGIVCLAEPRVISVARGRKSAGGKERMSRERDGGTRGQGGDQSGALLPLQSRVRPHSFICSAAGMLNLRCEFRATTHLVRWAPGLLVYGSCVRIVHTHIHTYTRSYACGATATLTTGADICQDGSYYLVTVQQKSMHYVIALLDRVLERDLVVMCRTFREAWAITLLF